MKKICMITTVSITMKSFVVETAKYLSYDYELHISGSGAPNFVSEIARKIEKHNKLNEGCKIVYHGQLSEDKLDELALSCDIGLNLQDVNNPFEGVSFPSKITFYLQHGLSVVSTKMSSVLSSKLVGEVSLCEYSGEEVAKAVQCVTLKGKEENACVMKNLDERFIENLKNLL